MNKNFLIIDGYNLMHTSVMLKRLGATSSLQQSREQMLDFLAQHLTRQERERTKIVFDAINAPGTYSTKFQFSQMKVIFPTPGTDADSEIERMISRHDSPKQILVVSSDRRLQKAIKRRKGRYVGSSGFVRRLLGRGDVRQQKAIVNLDAKQTSSSPHEVSYWMAVFSDIESEIADEKESKVVSKATKQKINKKPKQAKDSKTKKKNQAELSPEAELELWQKRIDELYDSE